MSNIVVLYCGSAFTKGLYDKLLEMGVTPIMMPAKAPLPLIFGCDPAGIIITGSGDYVHAVNAPKLANGFYTAAVEQQVPVLGICYGMQRMAVDLGGVVGKMKEPEQKLHNMELTEQGRFSPLYGDFIEDEVPVWMSHNCKVGQMPGGFACTGKTKQTAIAAFEDSERRFYGVQFHPDHVGRDPSAQSGSIIITNFLREVCGLLQEI